MRRSGNVTAYLWLSQSLVTLCVNPCERLLAEYGEVLKWLR